METIVQEEKSYKKQLRSPKVEVFFLWSFCAMSFVPFLFLFLWAAAYHIPFRGADKTCQKLKSWTCCQCEWKCSNLWQKVHYLSQYKQWSILVPFELVCFGDPDTRHRHPLEFVMRLSLTLIFCSPLSGFLDKQVIISSKFGWWIQYKFEKV